MCVYVVSVCAHKYTHTHTHKRKKVNRDYRVVHVLVQTKRSQRTAESYTGQAGTRVHTHMHAQAMMWGARNRRAKEGSVVTKARHRSV